MQDAGEGRSGEGFGDLLGLMNVLQICLSILF